MLKAKPMQAKPVDKPAASKKVSENTKTYNKGWSVGKSKGRYDAIKECHEALRKAGKADLIELLPKVPVRVGPQSADKIKANIDKKMAMLEKLKKQHAEALKNEQSA